MGRLLSWATLSLTACLATAAYGEFPPAAELPLRADFPDPLVLFDGTTVDSLDEWRSRRAPELRTLFQHYMYGVLADAPANIAFDVTREETGYFDGKATLREIVVSLGALIHRLFT